MRTDEIISLPITELSDPKGCILWLWFTNNHMIEAAKCLETWGFKLKTILTWEKVTNDGTRTRFGTGHWLRNATEHCSLAVRGEIRAFSGQTLTNESTILHAPRREHSRKPEAFYRMVETLCPNMKKLEMFARETRSGWDSWGNEVGKFDEKAQPKGSRLSA
jgi:N6-adenosine-specific RNA methylase IME4